MWFFTGKGDEGEASLFDGRRLSKNAPEFELIGILDEATAALGLAISFSRNEQITSDLESIQDDLSKIMGMVAGASPPVIAERFNVHERTSWLESLIHNYGEDLDNPHAFVYAGRTTCGATIDLARTLVRKAERKFVKIIDQNNPILDELPYINRLSSFLFILRLFLDKNPAFSK